MKNRHLYVVFALILALSSVFCSCAQDEGAKTDSAVVSPTENLNDAIVSTDDASSDGLEVEEVSSDEQSADECIHGEDTAFAVSSDKGSYTIFPDTKTGCYLTEFTAKSGEGVISITLSDGRVLDLEYDEVSFDESESTHLTVINGLDFVITESADADNNRVQTFECIEKIDFFSENLDDLIVVTYFPETEKGKLQIWFTFENEGEEYTFHYADGHSAEKCIGFDSETETHYFYESEQE